MEQAIGASFVCVNAKTNAAIVVGTGRAMAEGCLPHDIRFSKWWYTSRPM